MLQMREIEVNGDGTVFYMGPKSTLKELDGDFANTVIDAYLAQMILRPSFDGDVCFHCQVDNSPNSIGGVKTIIQVAGKMSKVIAGLAWMPFPNGFTVAHDSWREQSNVPPSLREYIVTPGVVRLPPAVFLFEGAIIESAPTQEVDNRLTLLEAIAQDSNNTSNPRSGLAHTLADLGGTYTGAALAAFHRHSS